jgi:hypothetical protein
VLGESLPRFDTENDVSSDLQPIMDVLRVLSRHTGSPKIDRFRETEQVIKSWIARQDLVEQRRMLKNIDSQIASQDATEFWIIIRAYVAQQFNILAAQNGR